MIGTWLNKVIQFQLPRRTALRYFSKLCVFISCLTVFTFQRSLSSMYWMHGWPSVTCAAATSRSAPLPCTRPKEPPMQVRPLFNPRQSCPVNTNDTCCSFFNGVYFTWLALTFSNESNALIQSDVQMKELRVKGSCRVLQWEIKTHTLLVAES